MTRLHLHLAPPALTKLRDEADRLGISVAELVRRIVDAYQGAK